MMHFLYSESIDSHVVNIKIRYIYNLIKRYIVRSICWEGLYLTFEGNEQVSDSL